MLTRRRTDYCALLVNDDGARPARANINSQYVVRKRLRRVEAQGRARPAVAGFSPGECRAALQMALAPQAAIPALAAAKAVPLTIRSSPA